MKHKKSSYLLNIIVFISGTVVMILELTGSRILAPFVGNSLPVWTGLIGIILGSLSLGYLLGGKLADKTPTYAALAKILLFSAISLGIIPVLSKLSLPLISQTFLDIRVSASLATILLFALPSVLLGMVSPFVIRLRLENIKTSGTTAGTLYAVSTIGSIFGTFFAGFFLIAFFGSHTIIYLLALSMFGLTILVPISNKLKHFFIFSLAMLVTINGDLSLPGIVPHTIADKDTLYNRVIVYDTIDPRTNQPIRELVLGNVRNSAMYLENDTLVYPYTRYYRLVDHFVPEVKNALVIGAGGYSYPKDFVKNHPSASMDIIEIDPGVTEIAKQYFFFQPSSTTTIYHEDARTYLNREPKQYDAILVDAFSDYTHPFQLTTKEALTHINNMLSPEGVVITNVASAILGEQGKVLRSEYYTYKTVFPHVAVFPVSYPHNGERVQNNMIVASKKELILSSSNQEFMTYLSSVWGKEIPNDIRILTDEFAPVEYYAMKMIK